MAPNVREGMDLEPRQSDLACFVNSRVALKQRQILIWILKFGVARDIASPEVAEISIEIQSKNENPSPSTLGWLKYKEETMART